MSRARSVGLVVAAAALLSPFVATASAELEIHYRHKESSAPPGQQTLHTSSHCPKGESVVSGGARPGAFGLAVNSTYPGQQLNGWRVYYDNHGETAAEVTTFAVCVNREPKVRTSRIASSSGRQFATARCPRGVFQPTGGGLYASGGFGTTYVPDQGMEPRDPLPRGRWHSVARGYQLTDVVTITGYVLCLNVDPRFPVVFGRELIRPGERGRTTARCRSSERVIGGGGFLDGPNSDVAPGYIAGSFPIDSASDPKRSPDDGWRMYIENPPESDPSDSAWSVRAFAICVGA